MPRDCGPQAGCARSSKIASGCATTRTTSGASCASWAGVASGPPGGRWNATRRRSGTGRWWNGRALKKSLWRAAHHHLYRRKRIERTAASGPDLGAARAHPGAAIPLQLADAFGRRRHHLVELLLPVLPWRHPCAAGNRLSRPSPAAPAGQAPGGLGRAAGPSGAPGQRLYPGAARPARGRAAAGLRSGTQSSGVHLGLLETSRAAQLLSTRFRPARLSGAPRATPHAPPAVARAIVLASSRTVTMICKPQ